MGVSEPCSWGISCSFASGFLIQPNLLVLELLDVGFRVGAISAEDDTAYGPQYDSCRYHAKANRIAIARTQTQDNGYVGCELGGCSGRQGDP